MLKINFKEFKIKVSFNSNEYVSSDLRESFADLIYTKSMGFRGLKLAEKIYQSEGEIELDEKDEELFFMVVDEICTPQIVDAIYNIKEQQKNT